MSKITASNFMLLTDSLAGQKSILDGALSTAYPSNVASTVGYGAVNNMNRVRDLADVDQELDLLQQSKNNAQTAFSDGVVAYMMGSLIKALSSHISGFNTFIASNDIRVAPEAKVAIEKVMGVTLCPTGTFGPVTKFRDFIFTAASLGASTNIASLPKSMYAPANLEVLVASGGGATFVATLTCQNFLGSNYYRSVVGDGTQGVGSLFFVGATADKYSSVSAIGVEFGTAADMLTVRTIRERGLLL